MRANTNTHVLTGQDFSDLLPKKQEFASKDKNLALITRPGNTERVAFFNRLLQLLDEENVQFPDVQNKIIHPSRVRYYMERHLQSTLSPNLKLRDFLSAHMEVVQALLDDVESNVTNLISFYDTNIAQELQPFNPDSVKTSFTFKLVDDDMCSKFHFDHNLYRLLCTYKGEGTEWMPNQYVRRNSQCDCKDHELVQDYSKKEIVQENWVTILKGGKFSKENPIVHRSPSVRSMQDRRVLLRVDILLQ